MDKRTSESQEKLLREKVRQQFKTGPYPRRPLEKFPKDDYDWLFTHSAIAPYYLRNQRILDTEGKFILDSGCGTGYKALALAAANPGAKIVGVDISEEAIELAKIRLERYGFKDAEFYAMALEDLPELGIEFDYINCDETLYLLPDMVAGLQAMRSVLKPDGIMRGNFHSALQRTYFYRAQQGFGILGLMDGNPRETEIELSRQVMIQLKDRVRVKQKTWNPDKAYKDEGWVLSNYLLLEDKGSTIPEMFAAFREAELELVSMVKWQRWEILDLFEKPELLPPDLARRLAEISLEERLHLFEVWNPTYRLLDFWCGHPQAAEKKIVTVQDWSESDWQKAVVQLHPLLAIPLVKKEIIASVAKRVPFKISRYITSVAPNSIWLDPIVATCLLPLWSDRQPISALVERYLKIAPADPLTLKPVSETKALQEIVKTLKTLESCFYVFLERES
ncbi:MAG: class I SAM-dependent methyltransferase [Oscillatoria sp. SIO1A7]|nr:class I SAM-dependent methyltransferase [Oscillatoria sp. SIO1A7]